MELRVPELKAPSNASFWILSAFPSPLFSAYHFIPLLKKTTLDSTKNASKWMQIRLPMHKIWLCLLAPAHSVLSSQRSWLGPDVLHSVTLDSKSHLFKLVTICSWRLLTYLYACMSKPFYSPDQNFLIPLLGELLLVLYFTTQCHLFPRGDITLPLQSFYAPTQPLAELFWGFYLILCLPWW